MGLPFTEQQFFDLFAAYNRAVWPAQLVLVCLAIAMAAGVLTHPARAGRLVSFGLAVLWAWVAIAYHLAFFQSINPLAPAFAALSLGAAFAFAFWGGLRGGLRFHAVRDGRDLLGWAMVAYALLGYPAVGALAGHTFPWAPTFGLPCPTTLFTFGLLLLAAPGLHRVLVIAPLAWALIGGTAAFALRVPQDYGLFVAAAIGFYLLLPRIERSHGSTTARTH